MEPRVEYRESDGIVAFDSAPTQHIAPGAAPVSRAETEARRLRNETPGRTIQTLVRTTAEFVRRAWSRLGEYRARRKQYRELAKLDQYQLRDIGLAPGDLRAIADGTFFDDPSRRKRYLLDTDQTATGTHWTERNLPGIRTVTLSPKPVKPALRTGSDG